MVVLTRIGTIDVSALNTDFFGHSYYRDQTKVLSDMRNLINADMLARDRCCLLGHPSKADPKYWVFVKDRGDDDK
jgi:hypothetical protein